MPRPGKNPDRPIVGLVSLGCPKNLVDSEKILAILAEAGCIVGAPADEADVIIINTCGFLSAARDESLAVISEALAVKATGRARRVVVAGCLVNREAETLFELCPGIDAVVGVNDREAIATAVLGDQPQTLLTPSALTAADDAGRFRLTLPHTAYLRISEGCNRRCSFCTIPAIRGPFRSKRPEQILTEARELIDSGALELNVIGQDTTGYGSDLPSGVSLAELLRQLDALDGAQWIRLLYAYPQGFDGELIEAIAESPHVVPYVDMPLQHISDPILKAMRRGTRREQIERLIDALRRRVPDIALRTTFIAGFPGETDAMFAELLAFVQDTAFDALGVFEFSPEDGTPAAEMAHAVPDDVKTARAEAIMLAQQEIAFAANGNCVGETLELLVDGLDADGNCTARHRGQAPDIDSLCYLTEARDAGGAIPGRVVDWDDYDLIVEPLAQTAT